MKNWNWEGIWKTVGNHIVLIKKGEKENEYTGIEVALKPVEGGIKSYISRFITYKIDEAGAIGTAEKGDILAERVREGSVDYEILVKRFEGFADKINKKITLLTIEQVMQIFDEMKTHWLGYYAVLTAFEKEFKKELEKEPK